MSYSRNKGFAAEVEAANLIREALNKKYGEPFTEQDVFVGMKGSHGSDTKLSTRAHSALPIATEVKWKAKCTAANWMDAAVKHAEGTDSFPVVLFRKNYGKFIGCIDGVFLMDLLVNHFEDKCRGE